VKTVTNLRVIYKRRWISWIAQWLSASQEELYTMKLVNPKVSFLLWSFYVHSVNYKNAWSYTSTTSYVFVVLWLINHHGKFSFTSYRLKNYISEAASIFTLYISRPQMRVGRCKLSQISYYCLLIIFPLTLMHLLSVTILEISG